LFESDYTDLEIITIVVLSVLKFHRLSYQKTKYHPSTDTLRVSHEKRTAKIFWFLAKTTTRSQFMLITYIAFVTKMQKRQIPEKRFALIKKRYHRFWTQC